MLHHVNRCVLKTGTNTLFALKYFFQQRKGLTIVYTAINTYENSAWYVPFVLTLMAVFFAGLVSWMCFLLWRYGNIKDCSQKLAKEEFKSKLKYVTFF